MANKTFAEVQDFLKGKVILVANRGIPARRICRSIRERFDAVAAMTATDVDKTAPAASTAQELVLLGSEPRAYLDIDRIIDKAKQRGVVGIHPGWGFASEDTRFPQRCQGGRYYLHRGHGRSHEPFGQQGAGQGRGPQTGHPRGARFRRRCRYRHGPQADRGNRPADHAQGRRRRGRPGYFCHS